MRRLADSISYTATTLYLYFQNRDAIFAELAKQSYEKLDASLATATRKLSALEDLHHGLETTLRFGLSAPKDFFLLFPNKPSTCQWGEGTRILEWFENKLRASCLETRAQWIAPPPETASMLLSAVYGMVTFGTLFQPERAQAFLRHRKDVTQNLVETFKA
jgi:AcrR family transcriptional regulator